MNRRGAKKPDLSRNFIFLQIFFYFRLVLHTEEMSTEEDKGNNEKKRKYFNKLSHCSCTWMSAAASAKVSDDHGVKSRNGQSKKWSNIYIFLNETPKNKYYRDDECDCIGVHICSKMRMALQKIHANDAILIYWSFVHVCFLDTPSESIVQRNLWVYIDILCVLVNMAIHDSLLNYNR